MSLQDRMALWARNDGLEGGQQETEPEDLEASYPDEIEEEDISENCLFAYGEFISNTDAYKWLLSRLRNELDLISTEPNTIQAIGDKIMSSLPSTRKISRKLSPPSCSARFELEWEILDFFAAQKYENRPDEILDRVVTLTGSCLDAQAGTCAQYMSQTWPSSGRIILELIQRVLRDKGPFSQRCKYLSEGLPDYAAYAYLTSH